MTIGTRLFTALYGRLVGSDADGNRYFQTRRVRAGARSRRWVLYAGPAEASAVPAEWHAWLHHTTDLPIPMSARQPWQTPHQPNLTGTPGSYRPAGHDYRGGHRPKATGDYESWTPGQLGVPRRSFAEVATGIAVLAVAAGFLAYAGANTGRGRVSGNELVAKFDNVGTLASGSDVKIGGVTVGRVTATAIDPQSFQAVVHFTVQPDLKLPTDSSAVISSGGLLGGASLTLSPGGADAILQPGGTVTITQSASNLEDLLGKFIFNVGSLADATQKSLREKQDPHP